MINSILDSVKKFLGIDPSVTDFDATIIDAINTAFFALNTLGIGPSTVFTISDNTAVWTDFMVIAELETYYAVKTYVNLRTKSLFDPPTVGFLLDAQERQLREYEHRLTTQFIDQTSV